MAGVGLLVVIKGAFFVLTCFRRTGLLVSERFQIDQTELYT